MPTRMIENNGGIAWKGMSPRVALISGLLRGMGLRCPVNMQFSHLASADLRDAELSDRNHQTQLDGSYLRGAALCNAKIVMASMKIVHMEKGDLRRASFGGGLAACSRGAQQPRPPQLPPRPAALLAAQLPPRPRRPPPPSCCSR